jgi:hypothetical protein
MRRSLAITVGLVVALTGCGGSHHERVNPERMLDQAARHRISSADVDFDGRLRVLGVERLSQPLRLRLEGPYVSGGGERIPSFDWRASATALGFPVSGRLVSTGDNVFLSIYGDHYEVGTTQVQAINQRIAQMAAPDVHPRDWLGQTRVVGDDKAGDTDCERIAAPLRGDEATRGLLPLFGELGLPAPLAISGRATVCVGYDDRVLHGLEIHARIGIPAVDRPALGGATGALLDADVDISDVGEHQAITPPGGSIRPIRDLFLTLNDLGVPLPY